MRTWTRSWRRTRRTRTVVGGGRSRRRRRKVLVDVTDLMFLID
jgi:hypothetical protein